MHLKIIRIIRNLCTWGLSSSSRKRGNLPEQKPKVCKETKSTENKIELRKNQGLKNKFKWTTIAFIKFLRKAKSIKMHIHF